MPIGRIADLIKHGTESRLVVRASATLDNAEAAFDIERLWSDAVFKEAPIDMDGPSATSLGKASLKKLMEHRHAVTIIDGGDGPEVVGVPFPHVAIVLGSDGGGAATDAASELERLMRSAWENYYDDDVGPKVQYLRGDLYDDKTMSVFFGYGVYLPDGQEPQGRVQVRLLDPDARPIDQFDLTLSSGASAGFYRAQSGIVFGGDETRTAVSSRQLPPDVLFFLGTLPRKRLPARPQLICRPLRRASRDRWESQDKAADDEQWDGSFRILRNAKPFASVDYTFDAGGGRLWSKMPPGPALAIIGIAVPPTAGGSEVRRWWVDLDEQNVLVPSAAMPRKSSLIVKDGRLKRYDWQRYSERGDSAAAIAEVMAGNPFAGESRDVLLARGGHAFGYLECEGRGVFAFDTVARGPNTSRLDWLGRALSLQLNNEKVVSGLAAAAMDTHVDFIGGVTDLKLRCRGRGLGRPDGQGGIQEVGKLQLSRGERGAIGPLIVEFKGG